MKTQIINFRQVSKLLTGNPGNIRAKGSPKKYDKYNDAVRELIELVQKWIDKHKKICKQ